MIVYNTEIPSHTGMTINNFMNMDYEQLVEELGRIYTRTQVDNLFSLKEEM